MGTCVTLIVESRAAVVEHNALYSSSSSAGRGILDGRKRGQDEEPRRQRYIYRDARNISSTAVVIRHSASFQPKTTAQFWQISRASFISILATQTHMSARNRENRLRQKKQPHFIWLPPSPLCLGGRRPFYLVSPFSQLSFPGQMTLGSPRG